MGRAVFHLLPVRLKAKDAWRLGRLIGRLDVRNHRVLVLDRARGFADKVHEALGDAERVRSVEDLERFAGRGGGFAVAEIMRGLMGADVRGIEGMIVCRTYLSNYAAQRSIVIPIMLRRIRLEPKPVMRENPLDALRLEAFESVLHDLATVSGRAVRAEDLDEHPFTVLVGAGTVVEVIQRYPEEAGEIYRTFRDRFRSVDPRVRVLDLDSGEEIPVEEVIDGSARVSVRNFEDLEREERERLTRWMERKLFMVR